MDPSLFDKNYEKWPNISKGTVNQDDDTSEQELDEAIEWEGDEVCSRFVGTI